MSSSEARSGARFDPRGAVVPRARVVAAGAAAGAGWLPAAWAAADAGADAVSPGAAGAADGRAEFTPGLAAAPALPDAPATREAAFGPRPDVPGDAARTAGVPASLAVALPDFGAPAGRGYGGAAGALRLACARAADAREAELRAEFEAAWAAEADALAAGAAADAAAAYAAGVTEGRAAGEAAARAALADAAGALDAAGAEVRAHEARWHGDLEAHVAALAVAVARHVVGREIAGDDGLVVALVARAVAEFPAAQPLAARVHPDDVAALKAAWAATPRAAELRWVPDAGVVRGGALVEGRERIVDGRVDMALERVYRAISGHQA
jgi:flagellar biosynthesis/type III secretory pathway protein FliH